LKKFLCINKKRKKAPVVIEDNAWIGWGATILKGVTIVHHYFIYVIILLSVYS